MKMDKYYNSQDPSVTSKEETKPNENVHEHTQSSNINLGIKIDSIMENKWSILAIAVMIIIVNIVLRAGLLQYQGLFEPDGFFYYSVIRAEINAHYHVVNYLGISGFPSHNFIGEAPGLPYLTVIFYYLLHGITNLSALTIMRWMPILFGVIYAIFAYFLANYISKSRVLGLLAMLFVSLSSGNIARTAGTVYRGDSFITLFVILALLFMLKCFEEKKMHWKYFWAVLASVSLSLGIVIWNGAPFITVVYMAALMFAIVYGFIAADKNVIVSGLILSIALAITDALQRTYVALGAARNGLQLVGNSFLVLYIPILAISVLVYYLLHGKRRISLIETAQGRAAIFGIIAVVAAIILFAAFGGLLKAIASPLAPPPPALNSTPTNGSVNNTVSTSIQQTTQELQPPTYSFLWSSFNYQLYLAPIGVILFALLSLLIYKDVRFIRKDHFNLNAVGFLAILAYFLITAYLQASAIRFNAIISIPLSIFAAFAVYAMGKLFYHYSLRRGALSITICILSVIFIAAVAYNFFPSLHSSFEVADGSIVLAYVVAGALACLALYSLYKGHMKLSYIVIAFIVLLITYNFFNTYFESYTAVQADGVNPQFLQAMLWLKNNTASNATVLALWPDGSVVEGWANRTSYMDSVGGENGTRIFAFSKFLFSTGLDTQYLYSIHKPEYLISRNFWYEELGGIAQEGLVQNASEYGYIILNSLNSTSNGTAQFFVFSQTGPPYYKAELVIQPNTNSSLPAVYHAYFGLANSSRLTLVRQVMFLNSSNGGYTIQSTGNATDSANFTLLVSFVGHEVNGAYILGPELVESNVFRFTFLCNSFTCPYNDSNVSMSEVYANGDTRIFKINYKTAGT